MYTNRFVQLISVFSRKEMTRFYEFSQSPYHNKHKEVRSLVAYFHQIYPEFNASTCDRVLLHQRLFPGAKHDQAKLALIFTYSLRLVEQFLITEQFREDKTTHKVLLLENLRKKGQNRHYEKVFKAQQSVLDKDQFRDGAHFNRRFITLAEADQYFSQQARYAKGGSLQRKQISLDHFYLSEKLKDACEMKIRARVMNQTYENPLIDALLRELEGDFEQYAQVPPVMVYYQLYQLIQDESRANYQQALDVMRDQAKFFPKRELQNLYNYLQNHCIQQINKGDRSYLEEIFKLYKLQLEDQLLFISGYLPEWHYKNIVSTGLLLGERQWVKDFIENYKEHLSPEVFEIAYSYNLAFYYYETQQYDRVLQLLVHLEYSDVRYALNAKLLLLKTYYDLDEYETLLSLSDSFRQYLQRKKEISDFNRKGYYQLLKFTRKVFQIKMKVGYVPLEKSKRDLEKLQVEMNAAQVRFSRAWLEGKVGEVWGRVERGGGVES